MKKFKVIAMTTVASCMFLPILGMSDSISPETYSATLDVGESTTIKKLVTVTEGTPTSAKVDVFFLTDSTGSMGGLISAVRTSASDILNNTAGLGDVAFGVGEYKDIESDGGDPFSYQLNQDITTDLAAAQAGINNWVAAGGGDTPEANLYALEQVATTTSWRDDSTRILVWFGDQPGHDPRVGSTEASATAALQTENIVVEALDLDSLDSTGQATRITDATGGDLFSGVNTADIVAEIDAAIDAVFATYSEVSLGLSEVPDGVDVVVNPISHMGDFDRSETREFGFEVTFTGEKPGHYEFPIHGLVDGGIVATERDAIWVEGATSVPDGGSTALLLGLSIVGMGVFRKKNV